MTWQGYNHRLLLQGCHHNSVCMDLPRAHERNIHLVIVKARNDLVAQSLLRHQRHHRKGLAERTNGLGNPGIERRRGRNADASAALFAAGRTPSGLKRGRCAENRFGKSASLPVAIWRLGRPRSILSPTLDRGGAGGIEAPFNQRGRLEIRLGAAGSTAPRLSSSVRTSMNAVTTRDSGRCAR